MKHLKAILARRRSPQRGSEGSGMFQLRRWDRFGFRLQRASFRSPQPLRRVSTWPWPKNPSLAHPQ